jgi:hypothetical protein
MSLNHIQLTPQQVAEWYTNVLIEIPISNAFEKKIHYLGGNLQHILIVINKEGDHFLSDSEFDFLAKILASCKLTIADVAIINWAGKTENSYPAIISALATKIVVLFDLDPLQFGLPLFFPLFQIQPFNQCSFLSAPSLHLLESDMQEKKNLWAALKKLFSV